MKYLSGIKPVDILNRTTDSKRTEITLGMGYKIPIGSYNDSTVVYTNPTTGQKYYTTSPPTIQPTTGSQDFIFYGFVRFTIKFDK